MDCKLKSSVRLGTVFNHSHLTIMEFIRIVFHYFVRNLNAAQAHLDLREMVNARISPLDGRGSKFSVKVNPADD